MSLTSFLNFFAVSSLLQPDKETTLKEIGILPDHSYLAVYQRPVPAPKSKAEAIKMPIVTAHLVIWFFFLHLFLVLKIWVPRFVPGA